MTTGPTQLDYANEPAAAVARRRTLRRAVAAASVLAIVLASVKWLAPAWHHAQLLYWQGKCLTYTPASAGPVVQSSVGGRCATPWREFYDRFSPPGRKPLSTVFLHELRTPSGARRLVAVEAETFTSSGSIPDAEVSLDYHVIAPGALWRRPKLVTSAPARPTFYYEGGEGNHFDVHPGRPDPADPTHFTFDVRWRERTVTLDGWLRDDDTILLEPRQRLDLLKLSRY